MLKPVTREEKARFTLQLQAEKGTEEILAELFENQYDGLVDIWPKISIGKKNQQVVLELQHKLVPLISTPPTDPNSVRYHVCPGKGCKRIK